MTLQEPTSRMITVYPRERANDIRMRPGYRLHVLDYTCPNEDAPVVFCVHGLTRNAWDFHYIACDMAQNFRVLSVDIAGRGQSDPYVHSEDYTYPHYLEDCLHVLEQHGVDECIWLGTSMGGILGMMAAASMPERVQGLILNDIGLRIPADSLRRITQYAGSGHVFTTYADAEEFLRGILVTYGIESAEEFAHLARHSIVQTPEHSYKLAYDSAILDAYRKETDNFTNITDIDLHPLWEHIHCPVLLLRGAESDLLLPEDAASMAERESVTLHEIAGVGHVPTLIPAHQRALITGWLQAQGFGEKKA